ncbi:unnamed protein product [Timema podura]|uniref:Uncharacterized protein n=1 Tax=Timema podura TaxID=61482 RepID=A0ABN7P3V8_TIMPD|nr:unnamed protein product [Timema podura]
MIKEQTVRFCVQQNAAVVVFPQSPATSGKLIPRLIDSSGHTGELGELIPADWNVFDVAQFLRVNDCAAYCDNFNRKVLDHILLTHCELSCRALPVTRRGGGDDSLGADPEFLIKPGFALVLHVVDCSTHTYKIDGKSLLNLMEDDIFELTGGKVGPSLKIHDLIQQLKARVNPSQSRFKGGISKKMFYTVSHRLFRPHSRSYINEVSHVQDPAVELSRQVVVHHCDNDNLE